MNAPVTVRAPSRTSNPTAAILAWERATPAGSCQAFQNSATPTSVDASAPNMSANAIRCGMAVIGTHMPNGYPIRPPRMSPMAIHR